MSLSSPCEGQPCRRWSHGHLLLPTQLNVMSRQPGAWRDAFVGTVDGCHFDVQVTGFDEPVHCWHHEELGTVLPQGEPIRIAGTLLRLPIGFINVATDSDVPYPGPLPRNSWPPPTMSAVITDMGTGRGLDDRHLARDGRLVVLIDDARSFKDGRSCRIARTAPDGLALLRAMRSLTIDQLWLDHDLGSEQRTGRSFTVMPVVEELVHAASAHLERYTIGEIVIHTSNPAGAVAMSSALRGAGYRVRRSTDVTVWRSHG